MGQEAAGGESCVEGADRLGEMGCCGCGGEIHEIQGLRVPMKHGRVRYAPDAVRVKCRVKILGCAKGRGRLQGGFCQGRSIDHCLVDTTRLIWALRLRQERRIKRMGRPSASSATEPTLRLVRRRRGRHHGRAARHGRVPGGGVCLGRSGLARHGRVPCAGSGVRTATHAAPASDKGAASRRRLRRARRRDAHTGVQRFTGFRALRGVCNAGAVHVGGAHRRDLGGCGGGLALAFALEARVGLRSATGRLVEEERRGRGRAKRLLESGCRCVEAAL
mmetsp:Transcript_2044/g.4702  ORF Transcript_2044/g.4702 Transcript_2044/m.4702 type:complete len:276 (-) Transcript_2044:1064-1891(-)